MTLQECYEMLEGDYETVLQRIPNEPMVKKFVLRFPEQSGYEGLCEAMEKKDYEEGFKAAHTLKGVSLNLSFTKLGASSSDLTEALRNKQLDNVDELFLQVKSDYEQTTQAIQRLEES